MTPQERSGDKKPIGINSEGFVEITLRVDIYNHLKDVLRRYANGHDSADDCVWLEQFLSDLAKRDEEDFGVT